MRAIVKTLAVLALIVSLIWLYMSPGFESIITSIVSLGTIAGLFIEERIKKEKFISGSSADDRRARAERKADEGRQKVQEWGREISQSGWSTQAWHLLGFALQFAYEATEIDPDYQRAWTLLADIYCRVGEKELAKECMKRSYKLATPGPHRPGRFYREVDERIRGGCPQTVPSRFKEKYTRYWTLR